MVNILLNDEVENELKKNIPLCTVDLNIVSAFCKLKTLQFIDSLVCDNNVKKRILVRFLPSDLAAGATDKEIYNFCKNNNWDIYVDHTIHAKTYVFDKIKCIIGSANTTDRGLGIANNSNKEASSFFELDDDSYNKIMTLYKDASVLDQELYDYIVSHESDTEVINHKKYREHNKKIECLMSEDFPDENTDIVDLYSLRSFKWLVQYLRTKENKYAYFGEIASEIHNVFVKDPRPYRKDIKSHLVDLLNCIKRLSVKGITITRPNYSECIMLDEKIYTEE